MRHISGWLRTDDENIKFLENLSIRRRTNRMRSESNLQYNK